MTFSLSIQGYRDPFSGTGSTGESALRLGRNYIGIELKPEYQEIARRRLSDVAAQKQFDFTSGALK